MNNIEDYEAGSPAKTRQQNNLEETKIQKLEKECLFYEQFSRIHLNRLALSQSKMIVEKSRQIRYLEDIISKLNEENLILKLQKKD